ncbi:hypothetical protein F4782DRAFT_547106 [Xylaria castorea]|nr:hypothetical protein F4782DRAFT_547106 [Xylaria castorea]
MTCGGGSSGNDCFFKSEICKEPYVQYRVYFSYDAASTVSPAITEISPSVKTVRVRDPESLAPYTTKVAHIRETTSDFTKKNNPKGRYWKTALSFSNGTTTASVLHVEDVIVCTNPTSNEHYGRTYAYIGIPTYVLRYLTEQISKTHNVDPLEPRFVSCADHWWKSVNDTTNLACTVGADGTVVSRNLRQILDQTGMAITITADLMFELTYKTEDSSHYVSGVDGVSTMDDYHKFIQTYVSDAPPRTWDTLEQRLGDLIYNIELREAISKRLTSRTLAIPSHNIPILVNIVVASHGYGVNHDTTNGVGVSAFVSIWEFLDTVKVSSSPSLSDILKQYLDGWTKEGYAYQTGIRGSNSDSKHEADWSLAGQTWTTLPMECNKDFMTLNHMTLVDKLSLAGRGVNINDLKNLF